MGGTDPKVQKLATAIREAENVVSLTGAGISAPSGIPTFRGEDGVWSHFEQGNFHYTRLQADPGGFWRDRLELQEAMFGDRYDPNAAHDALARLGADGLLDTILTQNTDGLHERVARSVGQSDGSKTTTPALTEPEPELIELHGNAHRVVCQTCGHRREAGPVFDRVREGELPPRCDRDQHCDGIYKPDVVLFGEQLPAERLERARERSRRADVFLAIGSSLVVEPAASLPRLASQHGAHLCIVTLEATPHDRVAETILREDVSTILPQLRAAVLERS